MSGMRDSQGALRPKPKISFHYGVFNRILFQIMIKLCPDSCLDFSMFIVRYFENHLSVVKFGRIGKRGSFQFIDRDVVTLREGNGALGWCSNCLGWRRSNFENVSDFGHFFSYN
jgi:hypothetical protein